MVCYFHPRRRSTLLLALGLCVMMGSTLWRVMASSEATIKPLAEPLPQDPHIQVFFNQSEAAVYTEPYRQITRHGDDLEQVVISAIEQATVSVAVAVQELNLPGIATALLEAQRRGVQVRVILENDYANPAQVGALQMLSQAQMSWLDDTADGSKGSGLMHHKFVVVDQQQVITGSANFTYSGIHGDADTAQSRGNANMLLKIDSQAVAQSFLQEFNRMWGDGPGAAPDSQFGLQKAPLPPEVMTLPTSTLTLQFSPVSPSLPWAQSANGLIAKTLGQSTRQIDLALFVFSEQLIADQLQQQRQQGTDIRALIDPGFVYRSYSEALDMLGVALPDQRSKIETGNQPWAQPIDAVGTPKLPIGDKLHHKFAVIDESTVIVGSQNWSHAANTNNDETLMVIRNPTVAAHFSREFERLYREPLIGETSSLAEKTETSRQRCPS